MHFHTRKPPVLKSRRPKWQTLVFAAGAAIASQTTTTARATWWGPPMRGPFWVKWNHWNASRFSQFAVCKCSENLLRWPTARLPVRCWCCKRQHEFGKLSSAKFTPSSSRKRDQNWYELSHFDSLKANKKTSKFQLSKILIFTRLHEFHLIYQTMRRWPRGCVALHRSQSFIN